ncbi:MAG: class I adenylate-forming enzyme family protein [Lachnoclostridium sp.]|nr:class I adenylate-forming enzyme family protein [Lachnoclostridium sp.]
MKEPNTDKEDIIFCGRNYWSEEILDGLVKKRIDGREFSVYCNAPVSLYDSLKNAEKKWPDKICLVDDDGTFFTYERFLKLVDGFSTFLHREYRIGHGSHVGVLLYNSLEYCASIYALNRLGAVMVPLSTKYKEQETKSFIKRADLSGIIFHKDFEEWFLKEDTEMFQLCMDIGRLKELAVENETCAAEDEEILPIPKENDTAIMMFTSGTTSRSKGVLLKNYSVMHAIMVYQRIFQIDDTDNTILPIPAYHITGLAAVIGLFIHAGGCVWLHKFFDANRIAKEMEQKPITFFHASPTIFSMLLTEKKEHPDILLLEKIACGSGNMPQAKIQEMKEWIPTMEFHTVYGLTETSSPATIFPGDAAAGEHRGSAGRPIPGIEFKICDRRGCTLKPGMVGTVCVKGTVVTSGYYGIENQELSDGWLDTGDIGRIDQEGYLYIVDRKKDMINRGGEKVCSYDVENVLYEVPGVHEAAVIGIPDEIYGEVPAAMIVPEKNKALKEEDIRVYLKERLAKFQIPAVIVFAGSLPMTPGMKIDKNKIRILLQSDYGRKKL